jgi:hypothetical protein
MDPRDEGERFLHVLIEKKFHTSFLSKFTGPENVPEIVHVVY